MCMGGKENIAVVLVKCVVANRCLKIIGKDVDPVPSRKHYTRNKTWQYLAFFFIYNTEEIVPGGCLLLVG